MGRQIAYAVCRRLETAWYFLHGGKGFPQKCFKSRAHFYAPLGISDSRGASKAGPFIHVLVSPHVSNPDTYSPCSRLRYPGLNFQSVGQTLTRRVGQRRRHGGTSRSRFAAQFPAWFFPYTIPLPALPWGKALGARFGEEYPFPEPHSRLTVGMESGYTGKISLEFYGGRNFSQACVFFLVKALQRAR